MSADWRPLFSIADLPWAARSHRSSFCGSIFAGDGVPRLSSRDCLDCCGWCFGGAFIIVRSNIRSSLKWNAECWQQTGKDMSRQKTSVVHDSELSHCSRVGGRLLVGFTNL